MKSLVIFELWLWRLLFLVLPLGTAWVLAFGRVEMDAWAMGNVALYAVDAVAIGILGVAAALLRLRRRVWGVILAFVVFLGVRFGAAYVLGSGGIAYEMGILMALRVGLGLGLFVLVFEQKVMRATEAMQWWLAGAVLPIGLGIFQAVRGVDIVANVWLGIAPHVVDAPGTAVIEIAGERVLRAYGTLAHPNVLGAYGVLCVLLWERLGADGVRLGGLVHSAKQRLGYAVMGLVLGFGIAVTFSRAALLALGVYAVCVWFERGWRDMRRLVYVGIGCVLAVLLFFPAFAVRSGVGEGRLEERSTRERVTSLRDGWNMLVHAPMFGVGTGQSVVRLVEEAKSMQASGESEMVAKKRVWDAEPAHLVLLLLLAEWGIVGIVAFGMVLFVLWREASGLGDTQIKPRRILPELVAIGVLGLFDHALVTSPQLVYAVPLALGFLVYSYAESGT